MRFAQNAKAAALLELELLVEVFTEDDVEVDVLVGAGLEVAAEVAADVGVGVLEPPPPPPPPQAVSKLIRVADINQGVVRMFILLLIY